MPNLQLRLGVRLGSKLLATVTIVAACRHSGQCLVILTIWLKNTEKLLLCWWQYQRQTINTNTNPSTRVHLKSKLFCYFSFRAIVECWDSWVYRISMVSGGGKLSVVATIMSLRKVGSVQNNCLNMVRTATITSGNNTLCKLTYGKLDRIQDAFSSKHSVIKLTCAFRKKIK